MGENYFPVQIYRLVIVAYVSSLLKVQYVGKRRKAWKLSMVHDDDITDQPYAS
jgi:hypothetical protein